MSIKRWIRNWLHNDGGAVISRTAEGVPEPSNDATNITIHNALNGKVLTLRTYQPGKNHTLRSDWVTEFYVLKEGESLPDAITMLLLLKGLK